MKAAKTIDEIYEEVRDYDIVISNDAPLVTALNNRIDVPRIGRLASTPMMIAKDHEDLILEKLMAAGICSRSGKMGITDDVKLLEIISELTGYDIKFVHGEIENIRTIRRHTDNVEKYLFGKPSKAIYETFREQPTYEMVMGVFGDEEQKAAYSGKRIAVIGVDLFDDLDKHFIPFNFKYDEVDIFKDGRYDLGTVYAVGNDRQVAEHAADLITNENEEDVAIVMDSKGPISDAVRSALYRKGIAFRNTLPARDVVSVRDYMEFIRKALNFETLTVGDVRELYAAYGARRTSSRFDEYLLSRYAAIGDDDLRGLSEVMRNIKGYTFSGLCDRIVDRRYRTTVRMVLDGLDLSGLEINERNESRASYLIASMDGIRHNAEIPDSEKRGVLLADCGDSMFIDRPFVIYLNMDGAWVRSSVGKEYVGQDEEEKERQRFQVLLQQGSSRMYIVNTMKNGKIARPCIFFDRTNTDENGTMRKTDSFEDLVNTDIKKGTWIHPEERTAEIEHSVNIVPAQIQKLSKTSMNEYVRCPRAYMFSEFVRGPDTESTVFGILMHEFAEFCLCYPDIAEKNTERCAEIISGICAGISCPERKDLDRSKIVMSITNLSRFIASLNANVPLNVKKEKKNRFFEEFGVSMTSDAAETGLASERNPLRGWFDLLLGNRIIDYKTGRPQTASDIAGKMDLGKKNDHFELQPFVYLSILDDVLNDNEKKEFTLFYILDNETESLDPGFDIRRNTRTVTLLDVRKAEMIRNGTILDLVTRTDDRAFIRNIGSGFNNALLEAGIENAEDWENYEELYEKILSLQEKRTKGVSKAIRYAIKKAGEYISGCFIKDGSRILIPRESIERFKEYSRTVYSRISEQQVTGFPYEPRTDCKRCGFFHMCTGGRTDDESE